MEVPALVAGPGVERMQANVDTAKALAPEPFKPGRHQKLIA